MQGVEFLKPGQLLIVLDLEARSEKEREFFERLKSGSIDAKDLRYSRMGKKKYRRLQRYNSSPKGGYAWSRGAELGDV